MGMINKNVREIITEYTGNKQIKNDDVLLETGVDSISMIEIVVIIEEKFGIEFNPENLNYETLKTINSICKYIETVIKPGDDGE